jgi:hypothetical protein
MSLDRTSRRDYVTDLYQDPSFPSAKDTRGAWQSASLVRAGAFLLLCFAVALLAALHEYFLFTNMKEFFALRDIMHHEVIEVTVVSFGLGVFANSLASKIRRPRKRKPMLQIPVPIARRSAADQRSLVAKAH